MKKYVFFVSRGDANVVKLRYVATIMHKCYFSFQVSNLLVGTSTCGGPCTYVVMPMPNIAEHSIH